MARFQSGFRGGNKFELGNFFLTEKGSSLEAPLARKLEWPNVTNVAGRL